MNETEERIAAFLRDELMVDAESLHPETALFSDGVVDSFSLMEIIQFVEEREGIEVADGDVTLENFDSIRRIAAYVTRKKNGA